MFDTESTYINRKNLNFMLKPATEKAVSGIKQKMKMKKSAGTDDIIG